MITEDAKKILDTLASFFNENEGNRINRWLAVPLINTIKTDIQEILQRDSYVPPEIDKSVEEDILKKEIEKLKCENVILKDLIKNPELHNTEVSDSEDSPVEDLDLEDSPVECINEE